MHEEIRAHRAVANNSAISLPRESDDTVTSYPLSLPSETLPSLPSPPARSFATYNYPLHPSESFLPSPKPHRLRHFTPLLRSLRLTCGLVVSTHLPCALASDSATSSPLPSTLLCSHPEPYPGPSVSRHLAVRSEHVPFPPFSTCHCDLHPLSPAFPLLVCHLTHTSAPPSSSDSHRAPPLRYLLSALASIFD